MKALIIATLPIFRNNTGQITGTATRDSNGTTTFRDAGGRTTGTATAPRR